MRDTGEFSLVTRRKKRAFHVRNNQTNPNVSLAECDDNESDTDYDHEALIGKLLEAETELTSTSYADGVFYCLKESLNALEVNGISDIVCYGLGHFSSRRSSKYQLALLLTLKRHYGSEVYIYDPIFSSKEIRLLKRLGFNVIKTNEEGRRVVHDKVTLLYMPHCSKYLTNNFLYTNWSKNLSKCILLTNSFSVVVGDSLETNTSCPFDYVSRIRPYVTEIAVKNNFMYEEAFNDLHIHVFLKRDIDTIPKNFWTDRGEPRYQDAVVDYLTAMQTERVDARNCEERNES